MFCTNCSAELPDGAQFCQRCGWQAGAAPHQATSSPVGSQSFNAPTSALGEVRLSFAGTGLEFAGWMLLWIFTTCLVIPLPWVIAAMTRWFCKNTRFSDGTTAEFVGTGGQVLVWFLVAAGGFAAFFAYIVSTAPIEHGFGAAEGGFQPSLFAFCIPYLILLGCVVMVFQWFVYNLRIHPGPPLTFTGSPLGFIGWFLLSAISVYTIVGWAWVQAAQYRWIARHIQGRGVSFDFHGKGHQILWRTIVMILMSCLIVTMPWAYLWLTRWLVENVTMIRRVEEDMPFSQPA